MNRVQMIGPPLAIAAIVILALAAISIISRLQSPAPLGSTEAGPAPALAGRPAPDWGRRTWVRSVPLTWETLRGRTVVVHLAAAPGPDSAAVSALDDLARRHAESGLTVIAVLAEHPLEDDVGARSGGKGTLLPAVVDSAGGLRTLYGLTDVLDAATVIVDRDGIVRSVLPGGIGGAADDSRGRLARLAEIELAVERLLGLEETRK